jgi:hypothetical protein
MTHLAYCKREARHIIDIDVIADFCTLDDCPKSIKSISEFLNGKI